MKNLRAHKSIFHCRDSLSVILLHWTALWLNKNKSSFIFPPSSKHIGETQCRVKWAHCQLHGFFFCISACYSAELFFPTPLLGFPYLQFAELKIILTCKHNLSTFFYFFAIEFEVSIWKNNTRFLPPPNCWLSRALLLLKGKTTSSESSFKDDLFFLSLISFVIVCISLNIKGYLMPFPFIYCLLY